MYGHIARRLIERAPRTDFERGVRSFGLLVARVILLLVVGVFAIDIALADHSSSPCYSRSHSPSD